MAYLTGAVLALAVSSLLGTMVGLDRDRAFYPTVTVVVASYYVLFAVMGGSTHALVVETAVAMVFVTAAMVGFRASMWLVAAALTSHGIFDWVHGLIITNPGMPPWWPAFCGAYDVVAGGYM